MNDIRRSGWEGIVEERAKLGGFQFSSKARLTGNRRSITTQRPLLDFDMHVRVSCASTIIESARNFIEYIAGKNDDGSAAAEKRCSDVRITDIFKRSEPGIRAAQTARLVVGDIVTRHVIMHERLAAWSHRMLEETQRCTCQTASSLVVWRKTWWMSYQMQHCDVC